MNFHPLANLFPLMEGAEFEELVADIGDRGLREPIWLHEGQILDGRNRWRACIELARRGVIAPDTPPKCAYYKGDDPLGFVVSLNLKRRHLTVGQRSIIALELEVLEAEEAKKRQAQGGGDQRSGSANLRHPKNTGKASDKAAKALKVSGRNVQKAKRLKKKRPDLAAKVLSGEIPSLAAAERQATEDERKTNLARPVMFELPLGLHRGDFRDLSGLIADNSVELVFTDPPYDAPSADLYGEAARVAARILKPGGSFIAYSGQTQLPRVLRACGEHLRYWWTLAAIHSGGNQILEKLGIRCGWKPLIWYVKDFRADVQNVLMDTVTGDREKDAHRWQQAESEAVYFIEKLTSPRGLVVDLFLGGGTTAVAAESLGRPWIGFEIDADAAEKAAIRLQRTAA